MSEPSDKRERLELDRDVALVLFEMLTRDLPNGAVRPIDSAEQRALWNLEEGLEALIPEPFLPQYEALLEAARARLRSTAAPASPPTPLVAYVGVDDTLVWYDGPKRQPNDAVVARIRDLSTAGYTLYCWSSRGAAYAYRTALELRVSDCFAGFLAKPDIVIDDRAPAEWRGLVVLHPQEAATTSPDELEAVAKAMRPQKR
jgi:hypothetical protein